MRGPRNRLVWAWIAVGCALIVLLGTVAHIALPNVVEAQPPPAASGPGIQIEVNPSAPGSRTGTVVVQVVWNVPNSMGYLAGSGSDPSIANNSYDDLLFMGTIHGGVLQGNLSGEFDYLAGLELSVMSPITTQASLSLYATDQVTVGNTMNVYTYSDNLAFNPRSPPVEFWANVTFPSTPAFTISPEGEQPASVLTAQPWALESCVTGTYWRWTNSTLMPAGYLPLDIANVTDGPPGAEIDTALELAPGALELSFDSETVYSSNGSISLAEMSSNPSWSGSDASFGGALQAAAATGSHPIAMIALGNVSAVVTNYQWIDVSDLTGVCRETASNEFMTTVAISGLTSGVRNLTFGGSRLPSYWGQVVRKESSYHAFANRTLVAGQPSTDLYSVMENATGYTTAVDAYRAVASSLSSMAAMLGLMTTVNDVADLIPGAGDVSTTADALTVLATIFGDVASVASTFASISYSVSSHFSLEEVALDQPSPGPDLPIHIQENNSTASLMVVGDTYAVNMPSVYVIAS